MEQKQRFSLRKNKFKLGLSLLTVLATPIAVNAVASSDAQAAQGWVKSGNTWYFYNQSGTLVRNAWAGNYWLGADGKMVTSAWVDNGRYYVDANGAWVKDAKHPEEKKQGWIKESNTWYYYNTDGTLVRNKWAGNYWLGADGKMETNAWVDNGRYYVGSNGAWVKDAKRPEEKKQGWVKESNTWYYYNTDGTLARNKWAGNYWLGADGKMATNAWVDNGRYYVGSNGAWIKDAKRSEEKKQGWVKESNTWYYYNTDGTLVRNKWAGNYWLGADGKMATNSWVDNNRYYVDANGAWVKDAKRPEEKKTGWVKEANTWYYYNTDGTLARNKWAGNYWLGADGKMATNSWVDNNRYYVDENGEWVPNYSKSDKNVAALNVPQYYQSDKRWASKKYGVSNMYMAGCVPTSLAMVFSGLGQQVLPPAVADTISSGGGLNTNGVGTSAKGAAYAINKHGYNYRVLKTKEQLISALQNGEPVLATVKQGYFVRSAYDTHAIVLSGYDNGKVKAMDPYNTNATGKWYNINEIWNQRSDADSDIMLGGAFTAIGK